MHQELFGLSNCKDVRHDCDTLSVDGTQVCIFEKTDQISFGSFLKCKDCRTLESEIRLEILGNLTNQTLEGQLSDQQVSGFLVTTDLTKSDSSRAITVRLRNRSENGIGHKE